MSTPHISSSRGIEPSLFPQEGGSPVREKRAVHFDDTISETGEIDPPIAADRDGEVSCWDSFCNAFVDGFAVFAQTIVDFFINLFRSRDALDGLKDKIYSAIGSKQWDAVLLETAAMIKWTRDNKSLLTDSQIRRANAIVQDVYSHLDVIDSNVDARDTVLNILKQEVDHDPEVAFQYMVKHPRAEVVMNAMVDIARDRHLGNSLQAHVLGAKRMESIINAKVVLPVSRREILSESLARLAEILDSRHAVLTANNSETTRVYNACIVRLLKLIDKADDSENKEYSTEILDGIDLNQELPPLSEWAFYNEMYEKVVEILEVVRDRRDVSLRNLQPINTASTVLHAATKFKASLSRERV